MTTVRGLAKLPLDSSKCFWCETPLSKDDRTRDHLVSRSVAKRHQLMRGIFIVPCCRPCNAERCELTIAYDMLQSQRKRLLNPKKALKIKYLHHFFRYRNARLRLAAKYRAMIREKVQDYAQAWALTEINEVFGDNMEYHLEIFGVDGESMLTTSGNREHVLLFLNDNDHEGSSIFLQLGDKTWRDEEVYKELKR